MAASDPFQYAILRVVPSVERGECFNAGVIVFCRPRRYLAARVHLDERRLAALAPTAEAAQMRAHLEALACIAAGRPDAGPIARLEQSERFHWLVAPSSTVLQPSAVHTGLCADPAEILNRLFASLVLSPGAAGHPAGPQRPSLRPKAPPREGGHDSRADWGACPWCDA